MQTLSANESLNMAVDAETRRAKKRQTDRNAQRQHRRRQKQYIEGLEAQITLLKSAGKTEASQLAAQNLQLQDEIKQMRCLWDEMESIFQRQRDLRLASILNPPLIPSDGISTPSNDSNNDKDNGTQGFATNLFNPMGDEAQSRPTAQPSAVGMDDHPEASRLSDLDGFYSYREASSTPRLSNDSSHCVALDKYSNAHGDTMDVILGDEFQLGNMEYSCNGQQSLTFGDKDLEHVSPTNSIQTETPPPNCGDSSDCTTMAMEWPMSMSSRTPNVDHLLLGGSADTDLFQEGEEISNEQSEKQHTPDILDGFTELFEACLKHNLPALRPNSRNMPMLMFSSLAKDDFLYEMIQRASQNPEAIRPPVLIDFLVDNKQNSLSIDLKTYLEPLRKTRRISEYLATYWVLYLLLRWQILRSEDAYRSLPAWLRPTPLQLVVRHPVVADLIAWPAIREGMVHMSMSDSAGVYDVSEDVGKYLTVEISTSEPDLVHDPQQLVSQILDLNNWKLGEEFFNRYPQWKNSTV